MFIVQFRGGLGNQIFQYNFVKFLSEQFPETKIVLDTKSQYVHSRNHGGFELKTGNYKQTSVINNGVRVIDEKSYCEGFNSEDDIVFSGYWQDLKYFPKTPLTIEEVFGELKLSAKNKAYRKQIEREPNAVSIHARRGDYVNHFLHGGIATRAYFSNAIEYMTRRLPGAHFFVFTDDKIWVERNLDFPGGRAIYVEGNEPTNRQAHYDLFLMSLCKHHIISNSSFSFWAQQFNGNPDKMVIVPEYWFNEKSGTTSNIINLQTLSGMSSISNIPCVTERRVQPFFSLILTAYNQEDCIRRALSSILNQSYREFELIVVDDGSTDNTPGILREYASRDARAHVVSHSRNGSLHRARVSGVAKARAPYVVFLDGDDYFREDTLEPLHNMITEKPGYDFYEVGYFEQPGGREQCPNDNMTDRFSAFFSESRPMPTVWNKAYDSMVLKRAFDDMEDIYLNCAEDFYESIVIAYYAKNITRLDMLLTNHVIGSGISTAKKNLEQTEDYIGFMAKTLGSINDFLGKRGLRDTVSIKALETRFIDYIVWTLIDVHRDENIRRQLFVSLGQRFTAKAIAEYLCFFYEQNRTVETMIKSREYKIGHTLMSCYDRIKSGLIKKMIRFVIKVCKKVMKRLKPSHE